MGLVLLFGGAYLADKTGKPIPFAVALAVFSAMLALIRNETAGEAVLIFVYTFIYMAVFFSLIVKFTDDLVVWWLVLVLGGILWYFIPLIAATI